jgi:hypothetical protein
MIYAVSAAKARNLARLRASRSVITSRWLAALTDYAKVVLYVGDLVDVNDMSLYNSQLF